MEAEIIQTSLFLSSTDNEGDDNDDWRSEILSSTLISFVLPEPLSIKPLNIPPSVLLPEPATIKLLDIPPSVRETVAFLVTRVIARNASHDIVQSTLMRSSSLAMQVAVRRTLLASQLQLQSIMPPVTAASSSSESDSESNSESNSESASESESESEEDDMPTYSGTSKKYVDATDWQSHAVTHFTNGNMYIGDLNDKGHPNGKGKMKRPCAKAEIGEHRNWRGVRKVDELLQVDKSKTTTVSLSTPSNSAARKNTLKRLKTTMLPVAQKKVQQSTSTTKEEEKEQTEVLRSSKQTFNKQTYKQKIVSKKQMSEFFDGEWENSIFMSGLWRVQTGDSYNGQFQNWLFHGNGTYIWGDGESYEGEWYEGQRQGKGKYIHIGDGSVYEGEFFNNKEEGNGKKIWKNGAQTYEGEWKNGQIHGTGKMNFSNGGYYIGTFQFDKRCGHGILFWSNGYCYEGMWKDDQMHGEGKGTSFFI